MSVDILDEILERRQKDAERLGYSFGCSIPAHRERKVIPFLQSKGVVLEVKRASPSKGDIAPRLDAASTALSYVASGAAAISVLTEKNYFHGSLDDLKDVAAAAGERASVLRKDFLIDEAEIGIAYKCGADAVLLIARILEKEKLLSMAEKCASLGMTSLIELRLESDLQKFDYVIKRVDARYVVCGVNSRDLSNFSIDVLKPVALLPQIKAIAGAGMRVISESGIRTTKAAAFTGSFCFSGILLGEAAAKNPQAARGLVDAFSCGKKTKNSSFWLSLAVKLNERKAANALRPLVKICGLTRESDAMLAAELGADFLGFIFCQKSPRNAEEYTVRKVQKMLSNKKRPLMIGVVVDSTSLQTQTALRLIDEGVLDAIQFHSCNADFFAQNNFDSTPHYAAINIASESDIKQLDALLETDKPRVLIDAKIAGALGGTGVRIDSALVRNVAKKTQLWLAGGITPANVAQIINTFHPEMIDVSSGIESAHGIKDAAKMKELFSAIADATRKVTA